MAPTNLITTFAPATTTELLIQDAVVRKMFFNEENCAVQLSCQKGFTVINLNPDQLTSFMHHVGVETPEELEGRKVLAYLDSARVVGLGRR